MKIVYCRKCEFPESIEVADKLFIEHDGEKIRHIELDTKICPHIIENKDKILEFVNNTNDAFDIDYTFYDMYITCYNCIDARQDEFWLTEILLYLKGMNEA